MEDSVKPPSKTTLPRYENDCENCHFLGHEGYFDLYVCKQGVEGFPTVIARKSSDPWDYESGIKFAISGQSKPLQEALKRAVRLGYIKLKVEWIYENHEIIPSR